MLQCSMSCGLLALPRQTLEDLEPAFQCTQLAMGELSDAALERAVGRGRAAQPPAPFFRELQRETAAIVRIGLAVHQAGADQRVDPAADGGRTTSYLGRDLIERSR